MKDKNKYFVWSIRSPFIISLLLIFLLLSAHPVQADKTYSIESVIIDAQLNPDGSINITEKRTYDFKGSFHWATYTLPTENTGGVADFSLGEEGQPYSKSSEEREGTYQYKENSSSISVKWFFDSQNESRTFVLSFRILDVVKAYQDAAVLYYKFIGTGWDRPTGDVLVTVRTPEWIKREQVKAWAHGPLWGTVEILDNGSVIGKVQSLPKNTFWEIRALYPNYLFPQIGDVSSDQVILTIVSEETRWAEEANLRREECIKKQETMKVRKKYGSWVLLVLCGICFVSVGGLYNRYGRKHPVNFLGTLYSEIPSNISPALLGYLLHRSQIGGLVLVGTMLDLAERGFLKIKEDVKPAKFLFWSYQSRNYILEFVRSFYNEKKKDLQLSEHDLLAFIFDDLAEGQDAIDFKALQKSRSKFIKWFSDWKKEVVQLGESKGFWDKDSLSARNKGIMISLGLIAVTVVSALLIEEWAVVPGISAGIILIWSLIIPRRTPEFELEAKKWKALKTYLKRYQFRDSNSPFFLDNIGRFLVYGVVLGLSKQVVKQIAGMVPEGRQQTFFPWYVATSPNSSFSSIGFGEALSSLMSAATTTMSSASGTGGGASGGGGGGAGGSGGGAG